MKSVEVMSGGEPLSTLISFPAGEVSCRSVISGVFRWTDSDGGVRFALSAKQTCFHPVDHLWPDQPSDRGELVVKGIVLPVVDCVVGAVERGGREVRVGNGITARRDNADWRWLVLHIVPPEFGGLLDDLIGEEVELWVDPVRRRKLSAGHTASHLVALALNVALAARWRKAVRVDGLGHPDFDSLAIVSSRIHCCASTDSYRLGNSLRKRGFVVEGLASDLGLITDSVNRRLSQWVSADYVIKVAVSGADLSARREWTCQFGDKCVVIPCGGTHLSRCGEFESLSAQLVLDESASVLTVSSGGTLALHP